MSKSNIQNFAHKIVVGDYGLHAVQRNLKDVADGKVLVGQICQVLGPNFRLIIDVELLSVEWTSQFIIENDNKGERTHEEETELGMTVTQDTEVSDSVSASAGFSGWGTGSPSQSMVSIELKNNIFSELTYFCTYLSFILLHAFDFSRISNQIR